MDYITRVLSQPPADVDAPILIDASRPSRTISWTQYVSTVKRTSNALQKLGVRPQQGVGLLSRNDIYYYVFADGAIAAGAVFAGVPTFVKEVELATAISAAQLQWLFVEPEFLDVALASMPEANVVVFDPPGLEYTGRHQSLSKLVAGEQNWNANTGTDAAAQIAQRLFTSGTTGSVKAAELSHATSIARLEVVGLLRPPQPTRTLQTIGMYHLTAWMAYVQALQGQTTLYVLRDGDGDLTPELLDRVPALSITNALLAPRTLEAVAAAVKRGAYPKAALASLRQVAFAGAPCRDEVARAILDVLPSEAKLLTAYGCTETSGICLNIVTPSWVTGQVGPAVPWAEIKVISTTTLDAVPDGIEGEVCVLSPAAMDRYCNNPVATAASFAGRWFRTGDRGFIRDKQLTLTGRFKEIFKVKYEEVAPAEVEAELRKHSAVADAFVTSTPARDDAKDLECMAYLVANGPVCAQDVVDFIAKRMAPHKAPTGGVVFCEKIPRGAMGKPLREQLVKEAGMPGSQRYLTMP